ncbi:MAG TPA: sugar phosphate nucleotidyltransferase [Gemmatimonadaceae bacterium]|nr:sugar phosphate nucleotidyltransferase [Gemmatimonadaceae bacterium]
MTSRSPVRRVLLPCGGFGTRMQAVSGGAPKELLPVGGEPVLLRVLRECAASGIESMLVVVAPHKGAVAELARDVAGRPGFPALADVVVQHEARGLADAIRLGRDFADGEPMAVALPDNLFVGAAPGLAQVIDAHQRTGSSVVAMVPVAAEDAERRASSPAYEGERDGDLFRIRRIPDKPRRATWAEPPPGAVTGVGRYVFTAEFHEAADEVARALPAGAELDDIPVMQALVARGRLVGRLMHGRFLDTGVPAGYRQADELFSRLTGTPGTPGGTTP